MTKLRVFVLMHEDLVPPPNAHALENYVEEPWRTEFDVLKAVKRCGHEVQPLGVHDDLGVIHKAINEWKPDLVFNLLEEFGGEAMLDQNVVSYLEMLQVPYTGCSPLGLMLARDKALSKKLLAFHKIRVPRFQVFPRARKIRRVKLLTFPAIVKSLVEEASLGISLQSVVENDESLAERVTFIHEKVGTDAIAEQYIHGRELYVGVMGNHRLTVFPPWELSIEGKDEDEPLIATRKLKFDLEYQEKIGVKTAAARLPDDLRVKIQKISRKIFHVLHMDGYARLDFRMTEDNRVYFLEANPNPQLAHREDFHSAANKMGISYQRLIKRIIQLGLSRMKRADRPTSQDYGPS